MYLRVALLLLALSHSRGADVGTYNLVKRGAECNDGANTKLGNFATVADCAAACKKAAGCQFFLYGKDAKATWCWKEDTKTSECVEGWQFDSYDFYELKVPGRQGCTEPRAFNYDPVATVDNRSCTSADTCFQRNNGQCANCVPSTCDVGNHNYKNAYDTIEAQRVARKTVTVDGDLREWIDHDPKLVYKMLPFATANGTEVIFEETKSGTWYGLGDFSVKWMLRWDEDFFYMAADVTDDVLYIGMPGAASCHTGGLQAGFEVGAPLSLNAGGLQRLRSEDPAVSRLRQLSTSLQEVYGQPQAACSTLLPVPGACCFMYENAGGDNWVRKTQAAVLRNDNNKRTSFELAFSKLDLMGVEPGCSDENIAMCSPTDRANLARWAEGLEFGFSFKVNDADSFAEDQGWAGYFPHGLFNKHHFDPPLPAGSSPPQGLEYAQPAKAGGVRFIGSARGSGALSAGGSGGGSTWFGMFLGILFCMGVLAARHYHLKGSFSDLELPSWIPRPSAMGTGRAQTSSMASADNASAGACSYCAPLPISAPQ